MLLCPYLLFFVLFIGIYLINSFSIKGEKATRKKKAQVARQEVAMRVAHAEYFGVLLNFLSDPVITLNSDNVFYL
ncbi:MAG: hypothetical protein KAG34_00650 [Cocleimonas sp.]|nr:hypothetical protein [Cocleimonas sp.]